ncbi:hypothetical protein EVAR_78388_1 [Eumeta japonica]|uniref:Uncharacterized protein n=1 Tax=Eumeta variegata TaxID=151549 RepID=A0A4C1T3P9_EUMVA|nr:hypothetical protein EVAR_78388_1 [Eumeta japonica]
MFNTLRHRGAAFVIDAKRRHTPQQTSRPREPPDQLCASSERPGSCAHEYSRLRGAAAGAASAGRHATASLGPFPLSCAPSYDIPSSDRAADPAPAPDPDGRACSPGTGYGFVFGLNTRRLTSSYCRNRNR